LVNQYPSEFGDNVAYDLSVRSADSSSRPGALVLVAGRYSASDDLQTNIYNVTNAVYKLFRQHGYGEDRIHYLAPTTNLDPDNDGSFDDVNGLATRQNLENAITQWAVGKVAQDRAFTLYMMDHGSYDRFYLDKPAGQWLTPGDLHGWLNALEEDVPGVKINVIVDACFSGSFIDPDAAIGKDNRVVIASTAAHAVAYASGSGSVFSDAFIAALDQGMSLFSAFSEGKQSALLAHPDQNAWLDDNGDNRPNTNRDGQESSNRGFTFGGTFASEIWPPYVEKAEVRDLANGAGEIWAKVLDDEGVQWSWAVVYPPSYNPPTSSEELVNEPVAVPLVDRGDDWYAIRYTQFQEIGEYRIVIYAGDDDGLQSRPRAVTLRTGWPVFLPVIKRQ
jgi:hypothetical protein